VKLLRTEAPRVCYPAVKSEICHWNRAYCFRFAIFCSGLLIRDVLLGLFPLDCGIRADYFASNAEGFTFWHFDVSKNPGVSFGRAIRVERSPPPKRRHADSICAESDPVKRARVHVDVQISTPLCTHAQTSANKHDALHIYTAFCE